MLVLIIKQFHCFTQTTHLNCSNTCRDNYDVNQLYQNNSRILILAYKVRENYFPHMSLQYLLLMTKARIKINRTRVFPYLYIYCFFAVPSLNTQLARVFSNHGSKSELKQNEQKIAQCIRDFY